jgi:hypothetical protein
MKAPAVIQLNERTITASLKHTTKITAVKDVIDSSQMSSVDPHTSATPDVAIE